MPNNYVLLETIALTQSAASVTFDNLPTSGYTDLKIVVSARSDRAAVFDYHQIKFNTSTASFSGRYLYGAGSGTPASGTETNYAGTISAANSTASTFNNTEIYIPNYTGSTNKSYSVDSVAENNATAGEAVFYAGLWSNTAAITQITIIAAFGNLVAGSTFSLYGIAAFGTTPVLAPKATGGNIVANDGTYWYHAFTSSGNFVPQVGLTADCLVVAGGGGGGHGLGAGGGAGGYRTFTSQSLTSINYPITIGSGGPGSTIGIPGTNGVASSFAANSASGGGGGGAYNEPGSSGGSGGGGGGESKVGGTGNAGSYSPSEGNSGGNGGTFTRTGGGGGAGAVGGAVSGNICGSGGIGATTAISGGSATGLGQLVSGSYYFAGGGGAGNDSQIPSTAGAGGSGGGGAGGNTTAGTVGTVNTGGGGGGGGRSGGTTNNGAAGGSGVVIIRYPIA